MLLQKILQSVISYTFNRYSMLIRLRTSYFLLKGKLLHILFKIEQFTPIRPKYTPALSSKTQTKVFLQTLKPHTLRVLIVVVIHTVVFTQ